MGLTAMAEKFRQDISGKNVLIFGLGVLGRGLKDALYLNKCGANVRVTDMKTEEQLRVSVNKLKKHPNIKLILGEHRAEDILWADIILRNAGVKPDSDWMQLAKKNKKKIVMDESFFAEYADCKIIGITGTKGKSTVTGLLYKILKDYKKDTYLGGNVVGMATLPLLDKVTSSSWVVLELSSWQLQGFGDIKKSPNISVFTNIYPDHLNYYGSMTPYIADKKNIYLWQAKNDILLVNNYQKEAKEFRQETGGRAVVFDGKKSAHLKRKILGDHNLTNIAAAVEVAKILNVPDKLIKKNIAAYEGEAYRLQLVGINKSKKIKFINDSAATTVVSLVAGINSVAKEIKNKVILIFGGSDKNIDWQDIAGPIKKHCRSVVIINGTAKEKILNVFRDKKIKVPTEIVENMAQAVTLAWKAAEKNDAILLSPGCASFGVFKNEFDRGQQFNRYIKRYVR